jgi:hypothetical protein
MSVLHLIWIVLLSAVIGYIFCALLTANKIQHCEKQPEVGE